LTNNELTGILLRHCGADWDQVDYIPDRQANDTRYAMDCSKARDELGYRPSREFEASVAETVEWYRSRPDRWAPARRDPHAPLPRILPGVGREEAAA